MLVCDKERVWWCECWKIWLISARNGRDSSLVQRGPLRWAVQQLLDQVHSAWTLSGPLMTHWQTGLFEYFHDSSTGFGTVEKRVNFTPWRGLDDKGDFDAMRDDQNIWIQNGRVSPASVRSFTLISSSWKSTTTPDSPSLFNGTWPSKIVTCKTSSVMSVAIFLYFLS